MDIQMEYGSPTVVNMGRPNVIRGTGSHYWRNIETRHNNPTDKELRNY